MHRFLILFAVALIASLAPMERALATSFDIAQTVEEKIPTIPDTNVKQVLYSVYVGSISSSDILVVVGEAQVTLTSGDARKIACAIILGTSATATTGSELDSNNSFNVSPDMNRGVPVKFAIRPPAATSSTYVNFVVWASGNFDVDNQGHLQVLIIHQ